MDYLFLIGTAAAVLTTSSFIPQVVKAHKSHSTKDLSLSMYLLSALGLSLWAVYGFILNSLPIIAANLVTLGMVFYLLFLKIKYN